MGLGIFEPKRSNALRISSAEISVFFPEYFSISFRMYNTILHLSWLHNTYFFRCALRPMLHFFGKKRKCIAGSDFSKCDQINFLPKWQFVVNIRLYFLFLLIICSRNYFILLQITRAKIPWKRKKKKQKIIKCWPTRRSISSLYNCTCCAKFVKTGYCLD